MKECKNKGINKLTRCKRCDGLGNYIIKKEDNKPEYIGYISTCEMFEIERKEELEYIRTIQEYLNKNKIEGAREYLNILKGHFTEYDKWDRILKVHESFKDLGYKIKRMKFK